jgi:5-methylthioadenosine/S-adenosylhomocysteine deaminase
MEDVDSLISARWVVPVEPAGAVLAHHCVAVRGGRIVAVLPSAQAAQRYSARATLHLAEHALMPGLVNLHTHAAMTLMRGLADDLPLMDWLKHHVWPAEAKHVSHEFVHDGTLLGCAEMLRGGVTCFSEMYFFPAAAAQAVLEARMRAAIGIIAIELPTAYASDADDYIAKGLATRDALRDEKRLSFTMAPHAPYTVADRTFTRMLTIAEELDLPIHMHLHETREEIEHGLAQTNKRPLERLRSLGLVGPRLIAVHGVHLERDELALLARFGASVAHCPSSNLKLASGFAPVAAMLRAGINVGLGTDGAASNNRLDMFQEMRTAALLAKAVAGEAAAMPAQQALAAATLNGARALGLDRSIGSLLPGKAADLCAVSFAGIELSPCYDVISHLVYAAGREHVTHVWCEGELLVEEGRLIEWSRPDLLRRAQSWRDRLAGDQKA